MREFQSITASAGDPPRAEHRRWTDPRARRRGSQVANSGKFAPV